MQTEHDSETTLGRRYDQTIRQIYALAVTYKVMMDADRIATPEGLERCIAWCTEQIPVQEELPRPAGDEDDPDVTQWFIAEYARHVAAFDAMLRGLAARRLIGEPAAGLH